MGRYTVLKQLSTGQPIGALVTEGDFKPGVIGVLLKKNALAPVYTPPLSELPGWVRRGKRLAMIGIVTVAQFLDADDEQVAELFKYKTSTIQKWKRNAQEWITASQPARRRKG